MCIRDSYSSLPLNSNDIDKYIERLEEYRRGYKRIERALKKKVSTNYYELNYNYRLNQVLYKIKDCIRHAMESKLKLRENESQLEIDARNLKERQMREEKLQHKTATDFLLTEVSRMVKELEIEFSKIGEADDEELMRRKEDYPESSLQLERLSHKLKEAYQTMPEDYNQATIQEIRKKYNGLLVIKKTYDTDLQMRLKEREILKEKAFQTSALDIDIPKFGGYQSSIDIYSFQMDIEKMYSASTPKHRMSDLLKNKYLEDPAYSMVKSLDDIDEIWERLKKIYGDKKVLLNNKLKNVTEIALFLKSKESEKLTEGLTKVINSMNDLIKLAEKHGIENRLYHGEGLNMIYSVLGEGRLHRWFTSIADEDLEEKELWNKLIKFLERELKVVQDKALATQNFPKIQGTSDNTNRNNRDGNNSNTRDNRHRREINRTYHSDSHREQQQTSDSIMQNQDQPQVSVLW